MIPDEGGDIGFLEQRPDRRRAGLKREFSPLAKIKNAILKISRGWLRMKESPAAIENCLAKLFGYVDGRQIRSAQCRHE